MGLIQKLTLRVTFQWGHSLDLGWTPKFPGIQKKVMKCLANVVEFMTMGKDSEMKISPVILINKTCHSHHWFLASKCDWGFSKLQSRGCCHPPPPPPKQDCRGAGGMQEARWTRKQDWLQTAEVHLRGRNSISPGAWSSHTDSAKFLNLIPDLWCSVCLLP